MTSTADRVIALWGRVTRLERVWVLLALEQVGYFLLHVVAGFVFRLQGLLTLLFYFLACIIGVKYLFRLVRLTVWRLRNRLIVAFVLVGAVPILLIMAMLGVGMYILIGQVATYVMTSELNRRNEVIRDCAFALGWSLADQIDERSSSDRVDRFFEQLRQRVPNFQALLEVDNRFFRFPGNSSIEAFRDWSPPGFMGLVRAGGTYALAARVSTQQAGHQVEVFAYQPADSGLLGSLLPNLAAINFLQIEDAGGQQLRPRSQETQDPKFVIRFDDTPRRDMAFRLPPPKSWWDIEVRWGTPLPVLEWNSPRWQDAQVLVQVVSRPSLIIRQLFSTLGPLAGVVKFVLYVIAGLLLLVEIASLIFGISLTRSITRSVADLYDATLKVNVGNFSCRVPIRTKDQLSELAAAFNRMTSSIENLIIESKEKERLESELGIAREVQAQLFPKSAPRLQNLELAGICRPARSVSGDYYDFVQIDRNWTALAIGDVAGKGISAALLMASIQSSLRAQLGAGQRLMASSGNGVETVSTAGLARLLNQQLYESTSPEKFATFFCALYDEKESRLHYTNAGHLPPLLLRRQETIPLEVNGMVLGAFPDQTYEHRCIELTPGDLVVAYTDGLTEPENEFGEEFGEQRLAELLIDNAENSLDDLVDRVTSAVQEWSNSKEQADDMTLLLLRRV